MGQTIRIPVNEPQRLLAVRSLSAISSSPTPELAALAELAKNAFAMPYAAVNIVDEDWLRIAGEAGMQLSECPRDLSFCTRVVFANDMVVVPDLEQDAELSTAPYVTGPPHFRFYAGAPLELESDLAIGAFCILDQKPRLFTEQEAANLRRFARVASALLRLQKANFVMGLAENSLRTAAMTDPLTGFLNRSALDAIVDRALEAALASGQTFGALYRDMDGFKSINDTLGHHIGDEVLREAASRIRSVIRSGDIVVRMGGDEFAIFVPNPPNTEALVAVSERLLATFRSPFTIEGNIIRARLSIGAALAPLGGRRRAELLRNVDNALYRAKAAGRDCHVVFNPN